MSESEETLCGYSQTFGGKFEWKCVREIHDDDKPDRHVFRPFPIKNNTSQKR